VGDPSLYDLTSVKMPRLQGGLLRLVVWLLEHGLTRALVQPGLLASGGFVAQRAKALPEPPTFLPPLGVSSSAPRQGRSPDRAIADVTGAPRPVDRGFGFATVRDYTDAYRAGTSTPVEVAERVLAAIGESDAGEPAMRFFVAVNEQEVLRQAGESARRWREGRPLGALDGVPVAVKDELDATPYPTTVGTRFLGTGPAREDATSVARARAAGAVILGKANMHEIGMGVTGQNPHHGTVRNPYDTSRHTGGSSSGPAAAVASGLCPLAIGCDGGGSIRVPSAMCGVVGLKATWGRVSEHGAAPISWSMGHVGPIGATALDAAMGYAVMAGPDPRDPASLAQPALDLAGLGEESLAGLRLGVYWPWFRHASPAVVERCERLLQGFIDRGARLVEVTVPELEAVRVAHSAIITTEMNAALDEHYAAHRADYGLDNRLVLATTRGLTGVDYVHAAQQRTRLLRSLESTFGRVDGIVTPATALAAPPIVLSSLGSCISDVTLLAEIMRFALVANLSGYPAISFPAGYDAEGLPVGLQVMGRPWEEGLLLRLARIAEGIVERREPAVHYRPLPSTTR
jgi:Asp-tRNA(Asn)/Glu-tRNA(Gln) amidotransferase A subunit family amidase